MAIWILKDVVLAIHDEQLAEHGGLPGFKDEGALDSALDRPQNLEAHGDPPPDDAALAASYAQGIAKNHGFSDGNKRTSLVVTELFLAMNGHSLQATNAEMVAFWLKIADGSVDEAEIATWIRARI